MRKEGNNMKSVYFVRHGQTVWNVENKICGATDIRNNRDSGKRGNALKGAEFRKV